MLFVEDGNEKYISRWIRNREIRCDLEILFEWIDIEYKHKKKNFKQQRNATA